MDRPPLPRSETCDHPTSHTLHSRIAHEPIREIVRHSDGRRGGCGRDGFGFRDQSRLADGQSCKDSRFAHAADSSEYEIRDADKYIDCVRQCMYSRKVVVGAKNQLDEIT